MNNLFISLTILFFLQIITSAQTLPEFSKINEIRLLESNRDDVRKIFKDFALEKSDDLKHYEQFSTANTKIEVLYSDGKCGDDFMDFDVSDWKVISIRLIVTNGRITTSEIGIDLSKFKRGRMYDFYNYNEDLGLVLSYPLVRLEQIYFVPPKQSFSLLCPNSRANENTSILVYLQQLKGQKQFRLIREIANVEEIILDKYEIQKDCNSMEETTLCPKESAIIKVSAKESNPYNDELTFSYTVSGGKVVGKGAEVLWDLSGVKAGSYTITAAVDDGCGFCGKTLTKTVTVKECQNCK
ncbi:MAG: hypothetical protein AAB336_08995 [Acidobacteriota bacterium]